MCILLAKTDHRVKLYSRISKETPFLRISYKIYYKGYRCRRK